VVEKPDYITISLKVSNTFELISLILGWGSDVGVIKPIGLRKQIKELLEGTLEKYK
jgi:predicted DNA-binding transcriptional regulator YafY